MLDECDFSAMRHIDRDVCGLAGAVATSLFLLVTLTGPTASDAESQITQTAPVPGQAEYETGLRYYEGKQTKQDYSEASKWFREAADKGNSSGQVKLGELYFNGFGVERNYDEAVRWYRKAADQNDPLWRAEARVHVHVRSWSAQGLYPSRRVIAEICGSGMGNGPE